MINSCIPSGRYGRNGLRPVVAPAEKGKDAVIEGLDADVEAVHFGAVERREEPFGDVGGIRLDGDLRLACDREGGPDVGDQPFEIS